jgi:hypothetical protein
MFGVGEYTHAPFKIAIGGFYSEPVFRLLAPGAHLSAVDDTSYTISVQSEEEARYILAILNLDCTKDFLRTISYKGDKRRFSKDVLDRIYIPPFADAPETVRWTPSDAKALADWLCSHPPERKLF